MYPDQRQLRIPGPTPVPHQVLRASAQPMINHRGSEFKELMFSVLERLKRVFQTQNTILAITGSGTAAMEAAVANLVNPHDPVLALVGGTFGERWAKICKAYQAEVHILEYPWGEVIDPQAIADYLQRHPQIKAVFATHNESSTSVLNDLAAIGKVVREYGPLLIVDAVSSLGGADLQTDAWGIDVVCTASQKCLLSPPGLAFISLSQRAIEFIANVQTPRFYLDLQQYISMLAKGEPPFTPNIANFFALDEALRIIESEGLSAIFQRHYLMRDMIRAGIRALGLKLLVDDRWASPIITAVMPETMDVPRFIADLKQHYGVELAGGQGKLAGKIFRIGHMGYSTPLDMLTTLAAIETKLGQYGAAVAAAEQVWKRSNSQ